MKQAVFSLFTVFHRSRSERLEITAGEQAQVRPMMPLAESELRLVAGGGGGGDTPGPHGSWGLPGQPT